MHPRSISFWTLLISLFISGCTTSKDELLPRGPQTMLDLWDMNTHSTTRGTADKQLDRARLALHRPALETATAAHSYTRSTQNEIYSQFKRLPNPDLVMYVFPHLAGSDPVPVPGYSTVFPFYQRVQYAMPGERTEDY